MLDAIAIDAGSMPETYPAVVEPMPRRAWRRSWRRDKYDAMTSRRQQSRMRLKHQSAAAGAERQYEGDVHVSPQSSDTSAAADGTGEQPRIGWAEGFELQRLPGVLARSGGVAALKCEPAPFAMYLGG